MKRNAIEYDLTACPPLYPILLDADGKLIDGRHRQAASAKWPTIRVQGVKGDKLRIIARIVANGHRRTISRKERCAEFTELAKILLAEGKEAGTITNEIGTATGFDNRYVQQLLPKRFKRPYAKANSVRSGNNMPADGGASESLAALKTAVVAWAKDLKANPEVRTTPTEASSGFLSAQLTSGSLVCPHCKGAPGAILWGCCQKPFAEARKDA